MRTTTITLTRPNTDIPWHEMSTEHYNYLKANFIDEYTMVHLTLIGVHFMA